MPLNFRKFLNGLKILPKKDSATSSSNAKGELDVIDIGGKLTYHNGSSSSPVVTENHQATLTNKTLNYPTLVAATADIIDGNGGNIIVTSTNNTTLRAVGNGSVNISSLGSGAVNITSGSGGVNIIAGIIGDSNAVKVEDVSFKEYNISNPLLVNLQNILFFNDTFGGSISSTNNKGLSLQPQTNYNVILGPTGTGEVSLGVGVVAPNSKIQTYNDLFVNKKAIFTGTANSQTGVSVTITTTDSPYVKLTTAITSISGITSSANDGQLIFITNSTGSSIQILNEDGGATASNRIITGLGTAATLANNGSVLFVYNATTSRWNLLSGNQVSTFNLPNVQTITTTGITTLSNVTNDYVLVNATGVTVQLPASPLSGKTFNIKKIYNDIVDVTITPLSGTIDGVASVAITDQYDGLTITTDGANYFII